MHLCFGYAHVVHERPTGYSFLSELTASTVQQVSIESTQSGLDLAAPREPGDKTIILGALDLGDLSPETLVIVAGRIRNALNYVPPERLVLAPDCGMKYLPHDIALAKLHALAKGTAIVNREIGLT